MFFEEMTSKIPNEMPQKHRMKCLKNTDFLASSIYLYYLCSRNKEKNIWNISVERQT